MQTARPPMKPTKQRRRMYQAPNHVRHKLLAATLSPELRTSHGTKAFPVRKGDTVRVMRGDHKGMEGKISSIDLSKYTVCIEGITREKVDGTTVSVHIHPSKVMVTRLNLDDKWRKEILESRKEKKRKLEKLERQVKMPRVAVEKERRESEEAEMETRPTAKEMMAAQKIPKKKVTRTRRKIAQRKTTEKAKLETKKQKKEEKTKHKHIEQENVRMSFSRRCKCKP